MNLSQKELAYEKNDLHYWCYNAVSDIKNGFIRCGIIYLEDGAPMIAYHWSRKEQKSGLIR